MIFISMVNMKRVMSCISLVVIATVLFTASGHFSGVFNKVSTNYLLANQAGSTLEVTHELVLNSLSNITSKAVAKPQVAAAVSPVSTVIDAGAPLSLPNPVVVPDPAVPPTVSTPDTPYSLNNHAVNQLSQLGYSLVDLQSQGIQVTGHSGAVPRRCATGTSGGLFSQGMALRRNANYAPCPSGESPLYDAYRPVGYDCSVVYNSTSATSIAVLAHEIGHCLHFEFGEYRRFDTEYDALRGSSFKNLTRSSKNEIIADDFMICHHNLDTDFGASSYYRRFGISHPTANQCRDIDNLINTYLVR